MKLKAKSMTKKARQHTQSGEHPLWTSTGLFLPIAELPMTMQILLLVSSAAYLGVLGMGVLIALVDLVHHL